MSKTLFIILFSIPALFFAFLIFFVGNTAINQDKVSVVVKISPTDATLFVDGEKYTLDDVRDSTIRVSTGEQEIRVERDGFETDVFSADIQSSDYQILSSLTPQTNEARIFLNSEYESFAREEVEGLLVTSDRNQSSEEIAVIAPELPYVTKNYRIDIGVSKPGSNAELTLYITADSPAYYENARKWLLLEGYTPSSYDYIYRDYAAAGLSDQRPTDSSINSQSLRFGE